MTKENSSSESYAKVEEIVNWTLPGLTMYYRDTDLPQQSLAKYELNQIFRSQTFVDVSSYAGKPAANCRYVIASSKAAPIYQVNPGTEKWGFHVINCNSYFKVLDIYQREGVTQIFLLHIPYAGLDFFRQSVLKLDGQNIEEQIIERARLSLDEKLQAEVPPALQEKQWLERTNFPVGLDLKHEFFSLEPNAPLMPVMVPLHNAIKKMTQDLTGLNEPPLPEKRNGGRKSGGKKGGFWSDLFGR
ncbi:hypothetical protein [Flavilitoribacter nigricans]|uniref:Uncharacterized protein n=1 Tax=Flavilitoribacter nigricans (strain ATCC 23147 / DSM 23189 / NBRC 102662 / NCIMB 1420 / SS-2) TaxID=1122177 RepID=A0A2D0N261_FLAN2|nr:hypothetical protein [Flavilitoribacter nigricans]PHN02476.1 hypothetical protein CRP01_31340 [Flavilitoribacter nigricans DSM 23189 = NBRC 102662]